jgi:replicative DNA helicase
MDNELMTRAVEVRNRWKEIIPFLTGTSKDKKGWICPICGHGTNGDGLVPNPKGKPGALKCFGCNFSGDIIDLYQKMPGQEGVPFRQAVDELGSIIGLSPAPREERKPAKQMQEDSSPKGQEAKKDYTAYYAECRERITDQRAAKYLESRGISMKTAQAYGLGFDPEADTAGAGYKCPRIILPTSSSHYVARRIDGGEQAKKLNPKDSTPGVFNSQALGEGGPVFVVEGIFDALAIIEAGGQAVATCSTSNIDKLLNTFKNKRPAARLIIALDSDKAGTAGVEKLTKGLEGLHIPFRVADICEGAKDPNDALIANKASFLQAIKREQTLATTTRPDSVAMYLEFFMGKDLDVFKQETKTGYAELDMLAGGLYPGLYVVAAISSLGKTTFTLQMAEQVAAGGRDVLFFSLEQSTFEMVSKGIARRTFLADKEKGVTSLSIRKGYLPAHVLKAAEAYKTEIGERLSIVEGNFSCDISSIGNYIRDYISRNNTRPVVFVDYLQILQPTETRQNTKETVDNAVTELKRLSRELALPVIVISSVNRANYLTPIDFEALKESGAIEYTADVIWGLQLQCLNQELFKGDGKGKLAERRQKVKEAKAANPRKIELVCLKNRNGSPGFSCYFDYYPAYDLFEAGETLDFEEGPKKAGRTI